jgi:hypothetical protein
LCAPRTSRSTGPAGTYAHKPDPKVDAERDKVAQDLAFAGRVSARGLSRARTRRVLPVTTAV